MSAGHEYRMLQRRGQDCTISPRSPTLTSKCIITPSSKSGFRVTDRDNYWDGLILADSKVVPGESVSVSEKEILVVSTDNDPVSGQIKFLGAKVNAILDWKRLGTGDVDDDYNVTPSWETVSAGVKAFGELVTGYLRQEDPGLLPSTRYLFFMPSRYPVQELDRLVFNSVSCQVNSIDNIVLQGIIRIQAGEDTRGD